MEKNFAKIDVAKALISALVAAKVQWIRYVVIDLSNQIRSIAIKVGEMQHNPEMLLDGILFPDFANSMPCFADTIASGTTVASGLFVPDLRTLHVLPYDPSHAAFYGTLLSTPTTISKFCQRSFLKNTLKLAENDSVFLSVGIEIEFMLFKDDIPVDRSNYGWDKCVSRRSTFFSEVTQMLELQSNVCGKVYKYHGEVGHGQFELVIKHTTDVMKIADSIVAIRQTLHAVADKHGYTVSFLPKPSPDNPGNGLHFHLSFSNCEGGTNDLPGLGRHGLSVKGAHFTMGIVSHLPALVALTQPLDQSYDRMAAGGFSGYSKSWSVGDKESSVRICRDFVSGKLTDVEVKTCDFAANPYIALGAIITAGLDGIKNKMELCDPSSPASCELLPSSLEKAMAELDADEVLKDALGESIYESYVGIKKLETIHHKENPVQDFL